MEYCKLIPFCFPAFPVPLVSKLLTPSPHIRNASHGEIDAVPNLDYISLVY